MAKIVLTINANNKATESVRLLNAEVQTLSKTLSSIKVNKNLTAQINALTKHYKAVADAHAKITANSNKQAIADEKLKQTQNRTAQGLVDLQIKQQRLEKAQNKTTTSTEQLQKKFANLLTTIKGLESKYPAGTFDKLRKDTTKNLESVKALNTEIGENSPTAEQSQKLRELSNAYQSLTAQVATTRAETQKQTAVTKQNTQVNEQHRQSILSMTRGILKWQIATTLVMKPLRMLQNALSSINETLVKTEDAVISLQRVLPSGSASDSDISSRLYKIAQDYGQTFDNVSQIAENFARTGMSWADTIKATEAAVLALNVAELDAEEATNGLIAILSQFGLDASDLETVIDKLNKTADNFPVTTEKILAALQRTGSAADNANLSLDQTIALITALSKATGRSGENIGTALNSLIQYSSKSSALDTFAKLSEDTEKVVAKYRQGGATILDVWQAVSNEIKNLKSEQADLLDDYFATEDGNALKEALDGELEDIYTELGGVYDTANTFRKNYFIALLGNMDTVEQAMGTLQGAAGYSQDENQKYLDTYTAKLNTLKAQWEEIANSEQGLLGFKKGLVDFGSALLTFTQSVGGLRTVLIGVGSTIGSIFGGSLIGKAITSIQRLSIQFGGLEKATKHGAKNFMNWLNPFQKIAKASELNRKAIEAQRIATEKQNQADAIRNGQTIQGITLEQADAAAKSAQTAATNAATVATKAWGAAIKTALGWVGFLITAVSTIVGIVQSKTDKEKQAAEEARQRREEIIAEWEAIKDEATAFTELNKQYEELKDISNKTTEQEKEFLSVQENIVKTLGYKAITLKKLQEGTKEYQKKLEELTQAEIKNYAMQAGSAEKAAKQNWEEDMRGSFGLDTIILAIAARAISADLKLPDIKSLTSFEYGDAVKAIVNNLYDNGQANTELYSSVYSIYEKQEKASTELLNTIAGSKTGEYIYKNGFPETQEQIDNIVNTIMQASGATERWRETIEGMVSSISGFTPPKKDIDDWSNDISKVTGKYDDLISKLKELRDYEDESVNLEEKKADYIEAQNELLKAQQALENARNEATVRRFNQATGQWEWQTDEKKVAQAEEAVKKQEESVEKAREELEKQAYDTIIEQLEKETATNESILAILKEVAPLLGEDFSNAVQNAIKDKTGVDIAKPAISNFDAAQNYINEKGLKESDREKWTEDKTFEKLFNALTDEEKAKLKGKSYDSGGVANGLGIMVKATSQPESVNDPELTKKILSPVSNAEFNRYVRDMGIMFERSHQYAQAPIIERVGGAVDNRVNNSGQINFAGGLTVGAEQRGSSIDQILGMFGIMNNNG